MRDPGSGWVRNDIVGNPWIWGALLLCLAIVAAAVYLPPLAQVLGIVTPDARAWTLILGCSMAPLLAGQAWLAIRGREAHHSQASSKHPSGEATTRAEEAAAE
jgi:Ca2+-transporting ATPase